MLHLNSKIFRSYDIRGVYPDELNEPTARLIGRAFAYLLKNQFKNNRQLKVVVGEDMRLSSPNLAKAFIAGLTESGINVDHLGLVPVDAVYFTVGHFNYDGGCMITASHNPKEYGGLKMLLKNVEWVRGTEILKLIQATNLLQSQEKITSVMAGKIDSINIWSDYIKHILSFIEPQQIKPLKVVVDAGNGMAGKALPLLAPYLPIELIKMNFQLDGNFPAHPSNPLVPGVTAALEKQVKGEKADLGVIFDGDTDRLLFVDNEGDKIQADTILILLAKRMLEKEPGKGVAYNVICSKAVPELINRFGGKPIRTPVGYVNVSRGLKENDGILGGEVSAHYSFRDNFYADSGLIAFVVMLQLISQENKPLRQLVKDFQLYCRGDEVNLELGQYPAQQIIEKIKTHFSTDQIDELDGVTISFPDWWFNVRPSNTEPLLRITVEAENCQIMSQKRDQLVSLIQSLMH